MILGYLWVHKLDHAPTIDIMSQLNTATANNTDPTQGYIYCLSNVSMPGLVKIGMTTKSPEERADGLFTTGVPTPFTIEFAKLVKEPRKKEKILHSHIETVCGERVNGSREFFRVDPQLVRTLFELTDGEWWQSSISDTIQLKRVSFYDCVEDGCQIRHTISSKDQVLTGSFCSATNSIHVDDKTFTSLSSFAKYHYEIAFPERSSSANGWVECEVKILDDGGQYIWVKADKLRKT